MSETVSETNDATPRKSSLLRRLVRFLTLHDETPSAVVGEALREREDRGETIADAHTDMILRAARFDRLKVIDVMQPRAAIIAIEIGATLGEAARLFSESQHSRVPLYGETLDDPMGFAHVRDVMALLAPGPEGETRGKFSDRHLARIKRDILFVPASMSLSTLFLKMQSSRIHLALVVDEYGGTDGLVSMEDLVEQIVGDIADEHDVDPSLIQDRPNGALEADGRASIEHLQETLGASLALPQHEDEFDTAGGLAVALAGRLPQRGEILHHPAGFDIEIIDADPRRVKRLRIKPAPVAAPTRAVEPDAAEKARARKA